MEATGVRSVIERRFRLTQIADAFRYEETGRHLGKKGCSPHLLMLISVKPLPYMDYDVQFGLVRERDARRVGPQSDQGSSSRLGF
jgi:hypothetical protein